MQMKIVIQLLVVLFLLNDYLFAGDEEKIKLIPLQHTEGKIDHIGFQMKVPWMDGTIELRFPETLDSEDGMHFIDHYRADMLPLSKMEKYPEWKINESTGEISYSYTTYEGIEFGGIVNAAADEVHIEFFVKNHTDKPVRKISPQICLALDRSNDFNNLRITSDVFIWSDGKYLSLDKTTPTPAEKGRDALLVIARKGFTNIEAVGKTKIENPGSDIGTWWLVNETSDEDIIARESKDKKHLVAISWPGGASFLIYNSLNPCIHAGPSIQFTIDPKRGRHWYGTIYLMKNNPTELFERYKSGKRYN
ncbi:MAG: hypothetical protein AB1521_01380 [Bacteroidota bacterium]